MHEHLLFHASLRMASNISTDRRAARVEEVIAALGLAKVKDTLIGAIGAGISGGERRRLTYAAEVREQWVIAPKHFKLSLNFTTLKTGASRA